jgi:hypothetical protein
MRLGRLRRDVRPGVCCSPGLLVGRDRRQDGRDPWRPGDAKGPSIRTALVMREVWPLLTGAPPAQTRRTMHGHMHSAGSSRPAGRTRRRPMRLTRPGDRRFGQPGPPVHGPDAAATPASPCRARGAARPKASAFEFPAASLCRSPPGHSGAVPIPEEGCR